MNMRLGKTDLVVNKNLRREKIASRYSNKELSDKLNCFTQEGSLVLIDVADTIRPAPEKQIVWDSVVRPWRYAQNLSWLEDFTFWGIQAILQGWSKQHIEGFSLTYGEEIVMQHYDAQTREAWVAQSMPPLFRGVFDTVRLYEDSPANVALLSRGFEEVVRHCKRDLGIYEGYSRVENKSAKAIELAKKHNAKRVMIFGDLPLDIEAGLRLQEEGYDTEIVQVCRRFNQRNFLPGATIYIPQNWQGLYSFLQGE